MGKYSNLLLGGLLVIPLFAGCAQPKANQGQGQGQGAAPGGKKLTVSMVTDVGGIHDNSFNQSSWEGLIRAKNQLGINTNNVESHRAEDYVPNLTGFVKSGSDLTWGIGFLMADALKQVAQSNPNSKLAIVDSDLNGSIPKNVECVTFREQDGAFLMGVLAGKMTKTNQVGFIGGMQSSLISKFEYGYRAGVKAVNPNAKVVVAYAGAFDKPDQGKIIASQIYQNGADVIFHAAGATGDGVFNEAKERGPGHWVIGADRDESYLAPANTLSSEVKRVDNAVFQVVQNLQKGKFQGGQDLVLGLKEGGIDYAPTTNKNTPADVIKLMDDWKQKIISGQVKPPSTAAEFNAFKPS